MFSNLKIRTFTGQGKARQKGQREGEEQGKGEREEQGKGKGVKAEADQRT